MFFETILWEQNPYIFSVRDRNLSLLKNQSAHHHSFDEEQVSIFPSTLSSSPFFSLSLVLDLCVSLFCLGTTNKSILSFFFTWYMCKCHIFRKYIFSHKSVFLQLVNNDIRNVIEFWSGWNRWDWVKFQIEYFELFATSTPRLSVLCLKLWTYSEFHGFGQV